MSIEEIKKIFTAGTVFVPAHLKPTKNFINNKYHIKVHELDTFVYDDDIYKIILVPHDDRQLYYRPIVSIGNDIAYIISKPEKNVSQTNTLPDKWLFLGTPENLDLINQFRKYKQFPDFDINKYNYINYNGYGLRTIPFPGDNVINQNQFEEYCQSLGIIVKTDKTSQVIDNSSVKFKAKALNPWTAARTISGRMCNDTGFDALDGFNVLNEMAINIVDSKKSLNVILSNSKKVKQIELIPIKKRRII
jgi:hypothetical protein